MKYRTMEEKRKIVEEIEAKRKQGIKLEDIYADYDIYASQHHDWRNKLREIDASSQKKVPIEKKIAAATKPKLVQFSIPKKQTAPCLAAFGGDNNQLVALVIGKPSDVMSILFGAQQ